MQGPSEPLMYQRQFPRRALTASSKLHSTASQNITDASERLLAMILIAASFIKEYNEIANASAVTTTHLCAALEGNMGMSDGAARKGPRTKNNHVGDSQNGTDY